MAISKQKQILAAVMCASTMAAFYPTVGSAETSIANADTNATATVATKAGTVTTTAIDSADSSTSTITVNGNSIAINSGKLTDNGTTSYGTFTLNSSNLVVATNGTTIKNGALNVQNSAGTNTFTVSSAGAVTTQGAITAQGKITGNNGSAITATNVSDSTQKATSTVGYNSISNTVTGTGGKSSTAITPTGITDTVYTADGKATASSMKLTQTNAALSSGKANFTANNAGTVAITGTNFSVNTAGKITANGGSSVTAASSTDSTQKATSTVGYNSISNTVTGTSGKSSTAITPTGITDTVYASDGKAAASSMKLSQTSAVLSSGKANFTANNTGTVAITGTNFSVNATTGAVTAQGKITGNNGSTFTATTAEANQATSAVAATGVTNTAKVWDPTITDREGNTVGGWVTKANNSVAATGISNTTTKIAVDAKDSSKGSMSTSLTQNGTGVSISSTKYDESGKSLGSSSIKADGTYVSLSGKNITANNSSFSGKALDKDGNTVSQVSATTSNAQIKSGNASITANNTGAINITAQNADKQNQALTITSSNLTSGATSTAITATRNDSTATSTVSYSGVTDKFTADGGTTYVQSVTNAKGTTFSTNDTKTDGTTVIKGGTITSKTITATDDVTAGGYSLKELGDTVSNFSDGALVNTTGIERTDTTGAAAGTSTTTIEKTLSVNGTSGTVSVGDKFSVDSEGAVTATSVNGVGMGTYTSKTRAASNNQNGDIIFTAENGQVVNVSEAGRATTDISYDSTNQTTTVGGVSLGDGAVTNLQSINGATVEAVTDSSSAVTGLKVAGVELNNGNVVADSVNGVKLAADENGNIVIGEDELNLSNIEGITRDDEGTTIENNLKVNSDGTVTAGGDRFKIWANGGVSVNDADGSQVFSVNGNTGSIATAGTISASNGNFQTYADGGISAGADKGFTVSGTTGNVNTKGVISASNGGFQTYSDGGIRIGANGESKFTVNGTTGDAVSQGDITSTTEDGTEYSLNTVGTDTQAISYDETDGTTTIGTNGATFGDNGVVTNVKTINTAADNFYVDENGSVVSKGDITSTNGDATYSLNTVGANTKNISYDEQTGTTVDGVTIKDGAVTDVASINGAGVSAITGEGGAVTGLEIAGVKLDNGDVITENGSSLDTVADKTTNISYNAQTGTTVDGVTINNGAVTGVASINGAGVSAITGENDAVTGLEIAGVKLDNGDVITENGSSLDTVAGKTTNISYDEKTGTTTIGTSGATFGDDGVITNVTSINTANDKFAVDSEGNVKANTVNGVSIKDENGDIIIGDTNLSTTATNTAGIERRTSGEYATTDIEGTLEVNNKAGLTVTGDNKTIKFDNGTTVIGSKSIITGTLRVGDRTDVHTRTEDKGFYVYGGDSSGATEGDVLTKITADGVQVNKGDVKVTQSDSTTETYSLRNIGANTAGIERSGNEEDGYTTTIEGKFTVDGETGNATSKGDVISTATNEDGSTNEYSLNTVGANTAGITRTENEDGSTTTTIEGNTTIASDGSLSTAGGKFNVNADGSFNAVDGSFNVTTGDGTTTISGSNIKSKSVNGSTGELNGDNLSLVNGSNSTVITSGTGMFNNANGTTSIFGGSITTNEITVGDTKINKDSITTETINADTLNVDKIVLGGQIVDKDGNVIGGNLEINNDGSFSAAGGNFTVEKQTGSLNIGEGNFTVDGTTGAFSAAKDKFKVDDDGNISSKFGTNGQFFADELGVQLSTTDKNGLKIDDSESSLNSADGTSKVSVTEENTTLLSDDSKVVVDENGTTFTNGDAKDTTVINGSTITSTDNLTGGSKGTLDGSTLTLSDANSTNLSSFTEQNWNIKDSFGNSSNVTAGGATFDKSSTNGGTTVIDGGTLTTGTTKITGDSITTDTLNVNTINLSGKIIDSNGNESEGTLELNKDGSINLDYTNTITGANSQFVNGDNGVSSTYSYGGHSASSITGIIDEETNTVGVKNEAGNASTTVTDGQIKDQVGTNTSTTMTDGKVETNVGNTTVTTTDNSFSATGTAGNGITVDTTTGETTFEGNNTAYIEGGATNTTINGNTITTGKITTDVLEITGTNPDGTPSTDGSHLTLAGDGSMAGTINGENGAKVDYATNINGDKLSVTDGRNTTETNTTATGTTTNVTDNNGNTGTSEVKADSIQNSVTNTTDSNNSTGTSTNLNSDNFTVTSTETKDGTTTTSNTVITGSDVTINNGTDNAISLSQMGKVGDIDSELQSNSQYDGTVVGAVNAEADIRRSEISRVDNRIDALSERVGDVEERLDKVGAMAAAIANLRTMGYDPQAPTEIAIGVGQYKSETGIALGMFHYPNQDFMLSLSVSTSGDEVMGGIGATWKLGRKGGSETKSQPKAEKKVSKEVQRQQKVDELKVSAAKAKVEAQKQRHAQLLSEIESIN